MLLLAGAAVMATLGKENSSPACMLAGPQTFLPQTTTAHGTWAQRRGEKVRLSHV